MKKMHLPSRLLSMLLVLALLCGFAAPVALPVPAVQASA